MMKPEEDFDAGLVVDWRGNSPQSLSKVYKNGRQNAATDSPAAVKNESWTKAPALAGNAAPPVYYELSDSDGTPIRPRPRLPVRSLVERRAAAAVKPPSISSKLNANADFVTLDSDSDKEISPSATSGGKMDKLSQPRAQGNLPRKAISLDDEGNLGSKLSGTMVKLTETVPQGGLLDKTMSLVDEGTVGGSTFSGNPFKLTKTIPPGGLFHQKSPPSLGNEEIRTLIALNKTDETMKAISADFADHRSLKTHVPSTSLGSLVVNPYNTTKIVVGACDSYVQTTFGTGKLTRCAAEGPKLLGPAQEAGLGAVPVFVPEEKNRRSSPVRPIVEILTSDDDGCNSEPEWLRDHEPASPMRSRRSGGSVSHNYVDEEFSEQFLPDARRNGEVRDHDACEKRPSSDIPGHESYENRKTTVSSSATDGPKMMAPVPSAVRSCLGAVKDSMPEENRGRFPDYPVFDLTGDTDGCSSEPEWMREPNSPRVSWGQGSGADSHGLATKRSLLQIPGLESPENLKYTVSPSGNDFESGEELLVGAKAKRKRRRISGASAERRALDDASNWESGVSNSQRNSKARKGPLSEEELAAKEAQKQRERELKKARQEEEKRRKQEEKEELKRQKAEATEKKKLEKELEKENDKWRKGKFALQNTTVYLDNKVFQMKELGPLLLRQLGDKHYKFEIGSNPIQNSIVWKMKRPVADSQMDSEGLGSQADYLINSQLSNSQLALEEVEMDYVVVVIQGEDFADRVGQNTLLELHFGVRKQYPKHYICYIINGLMKHVHKKEQQQYKSGDQTWTRPNVEQALAEFITHHPKVHSRLCMDECEIADHIIGLTRGLAECPFKQKLTSISVKSNGEHVSKSDPNKDIIKKNIWLKFLVSLPKINGAIAIAIANQYPTMRSLLDAYLDRRRPEHEKELLLQDLIKETSGGVSRKVGPHFSKCIYRILMAKDGSLSTEDVQDGADHFI